VKAWCREHKRYVVIGGKEPVGSNNFYNTAFVIGPSGEVVFRQTKAVPIQFFKDGLPALHQAVWESPWGKIGICICYDLSYTRVTDRLVREGARLIVAPTMDVEDWGKRQHELHARIAPIRAAEYRVPIFRLASSGISQAVEATGRVVASAPCPGQGAMIAAKLALPLSGQLPLDRWLAPLSSGVTAVAIALLSGQRILAKARRKPRLQPANV
jgi:predicted amidohydrolase